MVKRWEIGKSGRSGSSLSAWFSLCFACSWWYDRYSNTIVSPFFRKGNWVVIGIYGVLLFAFAQIYGGFKVGFLKQGNVLYSLCLSILFVNVVTYFQVSLIGRHLMETMPFIVSTSGSIHPGRCC